MRSAPSSRLGTGTLAIKARPKGRALRRHLRETSLLLPVHSAGGRHITTPAGTRASAGRLEVRIMRVERWPILKTIWKGWATEESSTTRYAGGWRAPAD